MATPATPSPDSTTDRPPRRRRHIPLALRMFVVMLHIVAVGGTLWVGVPAYRQHRAIREIERLHGHVMTSGTSPRWLVNMLGYERVRPFEKVIHLNLRDTQATDETLARFDSLADLTALCLDHTLVTDDGLLRLGSMPKLEYLDLRCTSVSDAGLVHLGRMTQLRNLNLSKTAVTDAGLAELDELAQLNGLSLHSTAVTDASLPRLGRMANLRGLSLGPYVSDAGLVHLKGLSKLENLWLIRTSVTAGAINELKAALPRCGVSRSS